MNEMTNHDSDSLMDFTCAKCGKTLNRKEWLCYKCSGVNLEIIFDKNADSFHLFCKGCCKCGGGQ